MEKRYVSCQYRQVQYLRAVQLVTKDDSRTIRVIERDSMGRYYVTVPKEFGTEDYYLGVEYRKGRQFRGDVTESSSSVPCYKSYDLKLPSLIKDCVEKSVPLRQRLESLCQLFQEMTYDNSLEITRRYGELEGESRVNQFFHLGRGCCYESAQAFAAVVSQYLDYNTRVVRGLM